MAVLARLYSHTTAYSELANLPQANGYTFLKCTRRTRRTRRQVTTHKALRGIDWRRVRQVRRVDLGFLPWRFVPLLELNQEFWQRSLAANQIGSSLSSEFLPENISENSLAW